MTMRSEIRAALAAGAKTLDELLEACPSVKKKDQLANNLTMLKREDKIRVGADDGVARYAIDKWPEASLRAATGDDAPPPRAKPGRRKAARAEAGLVQTSAPEPAPANGHGAEFAITDAGLLAIRKGEGRVDLDPTDFARLRVFTERSISIWSPE